MKIYTRSGDRGQTSLVGGTRAVKDDLRIEAYGTVDELGAHVGYLHDLLGREDGGSQSVVREELVWVLERLMRCEALLAAEAEWFAKLPQIGAEDVERLERGIDRLSEGLPELRHFTLPCGHPLVSYSHVCRTVCRRAERRTVSAASRFPELPETVGRFLNRLSDYFYALGRRLGSDFGAEEVRWEP